MTEKPYLLIDVDGPLNPELSNGEAEKQGYKRHMMNPLTGDGVPWFDRYGTKLRVFLNQEHGAQLLALTDVFDLVWATTWEDDANLHIGPRIGLPELPVIPFKRLLPDKPPEPGLHWKTAVINAFAYDRPFAWIDDEVMAKDGLFLFRWHPHPFLNKKIDAAVGLTEKDFAELRRWAEEERFGNGPC